MVGDGHWVAVARLIDNERRCIIWDLPEPVTATALRVVLERAWGSSPGQTVSLFALEFGEPEETGLIATAPWPAPYRWPKERRG